MLVLFAWFSEYFALIYLILYPSCRNFLSIYSDTFCILLTWSLWSPFWISPGWLLHWHLWSDSPTVLRTSVLYALWGHLFPGSHVFFLLVCSPCLDNTNALGFLGKGACEANFFETFHVERGLYFALTLVVCLDIKDTKIFFFNLVFGVAERYSAIWILDLLFVFCFFPLWKLLVSLFLSFYPPLNALSPGVLKCTESLFRGGGALLWVCFHSSRLGTLSVWEHRTTALWEVVWNY